MTKTFENQTALVTGGSSGIGSGIAVALGRAGANVVVNYYKGDEEAVDIVNKIESAGGTAIAIGCDVSDEADVADMFAQTIDRFGTLDVLIANAGIQKDAAIADMTLDQWNRVLQVNLTGQFVCARQAIVQFRKQGIREGVSQAMGKIISISSVHEVIPWAGHVNYAASKGGVDMLMKSLALEVAAEKIRVNSIAPGAIATPINQSAWSTPEAKARLLEKIPYDRVGSIEDIGKAAVWLASDESDYVTGTTLFVDGGMTLYPSFVKGG